MEVVNTLMEPPEVESKEEETTKKEDGNTRYLKYIRPFWNC